MKKYYLGLLLSLSTSVNAAETGFNFMYSLGLTTGGDTLAYTTGPGGGSSLKSGGLFYLAVGTVYQFENPEYQLQATFGYHFDELTADNGSADFERTFFEIVPFYVIDDDIRLGAGLVNTLGPTYSGLGDTYEFKDAAGPVLEINWRIKGAGWWGFRYVDLDYDADTINGAPATGTIDGSYFGIMYHGGF